jgi:hypothetical protein
VFVARFSDKGLAELYFPDRALPPSRDASAEICPAPIPQWPALTQAALEAALSGELTSELPPLDLRAGTDFQRSAGLEKAFARSRGSVDQADFGK